MPEEKVTYCRICEPLCGMVATVEGNELIQLRPDKDNPLSKGFACPKGIAFTEIVNDPARVLHPLKKNADGEFERVSWDSAMKDIIGRLRGVHSRHGADGIGVYFGNPSVFGIAHTVWMPMFVNALGTRNVFSAGSQDVNNRFVASELLYGTPISAPIPDLDRVEFLLVIGANPLVSHGSVLTAPRIKEKLHGVVERGGRVVVVDPRQTETAKAFEWLPITPDGDAFLLLSLLHVLFEDGLADQSAIASQADGATGLRALAAPHSPEATEEHHGVPADAVRELAATLAQTERAAIYGRTGTCLGRSGTLTTFLLDAVNLVAGNLDREGGAMFGSLGIPGEGLLPRLVSARNPIRTGATRSRIGDFPSVLGTAPATVMAKEITTPGKGQIRAMIVSAGNPVLSSPNGDELEAALDELELMVSLDLYVNETNAHADYILPATTMYERADFPVAFQTLNPTPFRQATEAVIPPRGESREEWQVLDELMQGLWRTSRMLTAIELGRRAMGPMAKRLRTPERISDAVIRLSQGGDLFGLRRGGLNLKKLLREEPHGKIVAEHLEAGILGKIVWHSSNKVRLDPPEIAAEVERLGERTADPDFPLRLIGMRELRSENSWMHNSPMLNRGGRRQSARVHPADASDLGIENGELIRITSAHGEIELPASLTEEIKRGVVAVPHGWGHKGTGSWRTANASGADAPKSNGNGSANGKTAGASPGGANVNQLMSTDPADIEPLAGMAHLNGVAIRIEPSARLRATRSERLTASSTGRSSTFAGTSVVSGEPAQQGRRNNPART